VPDRNDLERQLRSALVPVEPPGRLSDRLERRLTELTDAAAGELADWELRAMRDPRNWGRYIAAAVVGGGAGAALILVRARQRQRKRKTRGVKALEKSLLDVVGDVGKRLDR